MNEPIPEHMDGRVIEEALRTGQQPVMAASAPASHKPASATDAEAAAIRERLERLGYL